METSESELLMTYRNSWDDVKTEGVSHPRDQSGKSPISWPDGIRYEGSVNVCQALLRNVRTCRRDDKEECQASGPREAERTDARHRDGTACNSDDSSETSLSEGAVLSSVLGASTSNGMNVSDYAKPFSISKQDVWDAYKRVKANRGAAGVDGQSISDFEENLSGNLYKLWNRLASGSYFPPPVRRVDIPKGDGKTRPLGIPTVADRIAQMVVTRFLQPILEPKFHVNSYGYRPEKSAKDALSVARQRCWKYDWVLDLDIKSFFETIDHELLMRAVRKHTTCPWVLLYIQRWLKAPTQLADGSLIERRSGTPQGGVASPVLSNLYLHYAFDLWMEREYREIPFERYADDVICHCESEEQAKRLKDAIEQRFIACHLELHPQKTKIVYCKDNRRKREYPTVQFDFLGYTFRPRLVKSRVGDFFVGFTPAISQKSAQSVRQKIRRWEIHRRNELSLEEIARRVNPALRGWINYYGNYYRSVLYHVLIHFDEYLARWAMTKYKTLRRRLKRAREWVRRIARRQPNLFAHWKAFQAMVG
jgi:RNA-directed DNA polymerase